MGCLILPTTSEASLEELADMDASLGRWTAAWIAQLGLEQQAASAARGHRGDALRAGAGEQRDACGDEREGRHGGAQVPPADPLQGPSADDREQAGGDARGGADRPDLTVATEEPPADVAT